MRSTLVNRLVRLATTGAMVAGGLVLIGAPSEAAPPKRTEGHVTGDAWISFSLDPGNPLRRFVVDAHGNPYKVVGNKLVWGDARGTIRFNHPTPDGQGGMEDNWGTIDVDYVMTAGPVAVVSGKSTGNIGFPAGQRLSISVYDDPRGRRFDRLGFSWGVVDPACVPLGLGPAPFTTYDSGAGYVVKSVPLPAVPAGTEAPDPQPACGS
ncbi:hypothetical protein Kfla_0227 [Kribbella flavida DSM 17836]|uniref:Uncharacterized protein n=1 Tax=Kribbella flavida (strain DSM 17836 / JCM 10339 / NBRC 14399) TaxID=479435 RepID=D2PT38_KRIFD|nr:hypothetical protein [Kribbella flavida]ADB29354.1 hypothetical protein Kfla_0227 [Kribbella flavida DSM 17836]